MNYLLLIGGLLCLVIIILSAIQYKDGDVESSLTFDIGIFCLIGIIGIAIFI